MSTNTVNKFSWSAARKRDEMLEPYEGKLSCTVLRRESGSNPADLADNLEKLNALPVHTWHGGKVHYVRPHVLHLMRGQVFEINGTSFFIMGGAASHDIQDGILDPASPGFEREYWFKRRTRQMFRVKGVSWWPEELPSDEEYEEAVRNLERVNWKVDCILSHCAPTSIQQKLDRSYTPDRLTDFLQMVKRRCEFSYWFLGHYHRNCVVDDHFIIQWEQMVEL